MSYATITASMTLFASVATGLVTADQTIRVGVDLVNFGVVVTDRRGAPISGLTQADFEILERGKPQQIQFFAAADVAIAPPLHLGFLLDASGSMDQDMKDVRTAAIKFLNKNEFAVDMTLVDFDTEVRRTVFSGDDYPHLIERIRMRKSGGMTAFYDALAVYLRGASVQDGQKVLVAYTDGGDTRSTITAGDVADLLKASDVTLYALGYLEHQSSSYRNATQMELQRFSALTGGPGVLPHERQGARRRLREDPQGDERPLRVLGSARSGELITRAARADRTTSGAANGTTARIRPRDPGLCVAMRGRRLHQVEGMSMSFLLTCRRGTQRHGQCLDRAAGSPRHNGQVATRQYDAWVMPPTGSARAPLASGETHAVMGAPLSGSGLVK